MTTAPLIRVVMEEARVSAMPVRKTSYKGGVDNSTTVGMSIGTSPTLFKTKEMQFLIMDAPRKANLHLYIKEMRKHSVTDIVRVCEPTYEASQLSTAGITVHEMEYKDGTAPPQELIHKFLTLVEKVFFSPNSDKTTNTIAVHCVAGLGRAPVMVAIACIEFENKDPVEVVTEIRRHRRGAINEKQLLYLESYKKSYKRTGADSACCIIL